jgi:hypothetical protein
MKTKKGYYKIVLISKAGSKISAHSGSEPVSVTVIPE